MRTHAPLAVILALFAIFTWLFITATPYRTAGRILFQRGAPAADIGAPDERQHANYVRDVMLGKGLPILKPGDPDLYENYQAHQPPLYYFAAAGWGKMLGADPESESGGRSLRLFSLLIGLGTLTGAYFLGFWATRRKAIALGTAAFGLMPMFVALHSGIGNDPPLFLLATWALALMIKSVNQGWTIKNALLIGFLIGLGILTKTSAVGLLPILLLAGVISIAKTSKSERRHLIAPAAIAALLPLLLAAPWWMRNVNLYGDPLAMSVFNSAFTGSPQASVFMQELGPIAYWSDMVMWWTSRSFIGVFGYMDIFLFEKPGAGREILSQSNSIYLFLLAVVGTIMLAGCLALARNQKDVDEEEAPASRPILIMAAGSILVFIILLIQFNLQYFQGQARYIYPAFGGFALLAGAGIDAIARRLKEYSWVPLAALLSLLTIISWQQLGPAFAIRTGGL